MHWKVVPQTKCSSKDSNFRSLDETSLHCPASTGLTMRFLIFVFSSVAACRPAELIVWVTDGRMCDVKLFSNRYSSYSFYPILTKLGTHVLCAYAEITVEQIFKILL